MQDEKLLERQQRPADKVCPENIQAIVNKILEVLDGRGMDVMQIFSKSNVPVAEVLMGFMDRQPDKSEVEDFLWRIRIGHMNQNELMMNGVQAVIVRLHAKRKAVADCDQTIATQQLLWHLDSQAALLEEYVNFYGAEAWWSGLVSSERSGIPKNNNYGPHRVQGCGPWGGTVIPHVSRCLAV